MDEQFEPERWYWDRRTRKALYPRRTEDAIEFVTIWHPEEVADALDGGALVPLEDVGLSETDTAFDLLKSFRTPSSVTEDGDSGETEGDYTVESDDRVSDQEGDD